MSKEKALIPLSGGGPLLNVPDLDTILGLDIPVSQKRRMVLEYGGLKGKKIKYASKEEKKAAAKKRAEIRKKERLVLLASHGLAPKPKVKKTPMEKKAASSARAKRKRSAFGEMVRMNPELAKKAGIDPKRYKLK